MRRLDRSGRRWLLVLPGSAWVTWKYREPCLAHWRDGVWIHRYREANIPHKTLGRAAPPRVLTAEAREISLHSYTPKTGDVVVDVGAGIGAEALLFSRLVGPSGRVVSIEAHPRTYDRLVRLCNVNRLRNVTPVQVAAGADDGEVGISDTSNHVRNTVGTNGIRVPLRRLESLAAELGINQVDFLKMNIEGAELEALRGMGSLLGRTRHVCISCHDFLGVPTKADVRNFLEDHGFEVWSRDDAPEPWTRDYLYGTSK